MGIFKNIFGKQDLPKPAPPPLPAEKLAYEPGDELCGDYIVKLPLGRGGMGEVYLVEHIGSGELRAAKVMRVRTNATAADIVGFRQEALALLNVGNHPFVVRLFEIKEHARTTVLIMEYIAPVSGCITIQDYIQRGQGYDDQRICLWAVQFCVGMEKALASGLSAHRDIKPGNLLIDSGVFLKIADFGLALAISHHPEILDDFPRKPSQLQRLSSEKGHLTCGTPGYIAPELFAGGKASPQSDMFSFGMTLWQIAARSLSSPYGVTYDGDPNEYQRAVTRRATTHAVRRIDSPYFEVIRRCLAVDPAQRYSDFPALREAIKTAAKAANIPVIDFIVAPKFRGSLEEVINRGRSFMALGRYERALRILDQAVEAKPDSPDALTAQAEALIERGQPVRAVRAYEAAHKSDPGSDEPLTGMASAWLHLNNSGKAREALDRVLARNPSSLAARLLLARVLGTDGKAQAALDAVKGVIDTDPHDWRAHDYHGRALWQLSKLSDAKDAFEVCLRLNPLALKARLALASLLTQQKRTAEASAEYQRGVRLFQDNPEALNEIAAHMAEHGHPRGAIKLFQELANAVPESRSIMMVNMGNAQLKLGENDAAVASYRGAIKADPANALAFYRLGDLAADDGDQGNAAAYFTRACEIESQNAKYQASAGTAYLHEQDYARAAKHLRRSLELYPEQPHILYNLAAAVLLLDDPISAIAALVRATNIDEDYARAWYLKAQIESRLGRIADAAVSARRAIANASALSADEAEGARSLINHPA